MLSKLLKHEFRATGRIILPLMAAILLLSAAAGVSTNILDNPNSSSVANTLSVLMLCLYVISVFAVGIVAFVLMIERFEKNLLGAEGYLMFTLPVSVDAHIFAKLIVSLVWFTVTGIVAAISILVVASTADFATMVSAVRDFDELGEVIRRGFMYLGNGSLGAGVGHFVGYALELVLLAAAGMAAVCLRFYCAMAIGYSFSNHKRLLSVAAFFATGIIMNTLSSAVFSIFGGTNAIDVVAEWFAERLADSAHAAAGGHLILLLCMLSALISAVIYYIPTRLLLKKRLNLA